MTSNVLLIFALSPKSNHHAAMPFHSYSFALRSRSSKANFYDSPGFMPLAGSIHEENGDFPAGLSHISANKTKCIIS